MTIGFSNVKIRFGGVVEGLERECEARCWKPFQGVYYKGEQSGQRGQERFCFILLCFQMEEITVMFRRNTSTFVTDGKDLGERIKLLM